MGASARHDNYFFKTALRLDVKQAVDLKGKMEEKQVHMWEREDFPRCSIKVLFFWMFIFLIFSTVLGAIMALIVVVIDIKFNTNLSSLERHVISDPAARIVFFAVALAFIFYWLRRIPFSFCDVWVSYKIQPKILIGSLLLGMLLSWLHSASYQVIAGVGTVAPVIHMWPDWRLMFAVNLLGVDLIIGIVEEIFFRGLLYRALRKYSSTLKATLFSAIIFTAYHIDYLFRPPTMIVIGLSNIFLLGIMSAVLFERTRSLSSPIGLHISYNMTV